MSFQIRHEGSPHHLENLTLSQVLEGLRDGLWQPTDEVRGPQDQDWCTLESHPQTAEAAADIEPEPPPMHDDETRLDMNPLIDVALVLLIFFILTTSYAAAQRIIDMPPSAASSNPVRPGSDVRSRMITVAVRQEGGLPVLFVDGRKTDLKNVEPALREARTRTGKRELLIDAGTDVAWGTVVDVQDAAKGAGMRKLYLKAPQRAQPVGGKP